MRYSLAMLSLLAAIAATPARIAPPAWLGIATQADSLYFGGHPGDALALCENAFISADTVAQLRWRAARAAIALGMIGERGPERLALYDRALIHARRATELAPTDNDARYWRAAAAGRRANKREAVKSARLAMEAYEQVTAILAVDSLHAGAHHALGMLHFQVRRTPRLVRFLAGRVLRIDIANQASDVEAERHLRRAVELDSGMVLYEADLAVFYGGVKKVAEQEAALARLVTMRPTHPADVALVRSRFPNLALRGE